MMRNVLFSKFKFKTNDSPRHHDVLLPASWFLICFIVLWNWKTVLRFWMPPSGWKGSAKDEEPFLGKIKQKVSAGGSVSAVAGKFTELLSLNCTALSSSRIIMIQRA